MNKKHSFFALFEPKNQERIYELFQNKNVKQGVDASVKTLLNL